LTYVGDTKLRQWCNPKTAVVTLEIWTRAGQPHRDNGPAIIERDSATGVVTRESWAHERKLLHREDGPAIIERDAATGVVTYEGWFREGKLHREDGPAEIERAAATGVVTVETWARDDKLYREDGPAEIQRDAKTGAVFRETWAREGNMTLTRTHAWWMRDRAARGRESAPRP